MKIKVNAGLTVPHPRFPYSSIRVDVAVEDDVEPGNVEKAAARMHAWVHEVARRQAVKASETEDDDPLPIKGRP